MDFLILWLYNALASSLMPLIPIPFHSWVLASSHPSTAFSSLFTSPWDSQGGPHPYCSWGEGQQPTCGLNHFPQKHINSVARCYSNCSNYEVLCAGLLTVRFVPIKKICSKFHTIHINWFLGHNQFRAQPLLAYDVILHEYTWCSMYTSFSLISFNRAVIQIYFIPMRIYGLCLSMSQFSDTVFNDTCIIKVNTSNHFWFHRCQADFS